MIKHHNGSVSVRYTVPLTVTIPCRACGKPLAVPTLGSLPAPRPRPVCGLDCALA